MRRLSRDLLVWAGTLVLVLLLALSAEAEVGNPTKLPVSGGVPAQVFNEQVNLFKFAVNTTADDGVTTVSAIHVVFNGDVFRKGARLVVPTTEGAKVRVSSFNVTFAHRSSFNGPLEISGVETSWPSAVVFATGARTLETGRILVSCSRLSDFTVRVDDAMIELDDGKDDAGLAWFDVRCDSAASGAFLKRTSILFNNSRSDMIGMLIQVVKYVAVSDTAVGIHASDLLVYVPDKASRAMIGFLPDRTTVTGISVVVANATVEATASRTDNMRVVYFNGGDGTVGSDNVSVAVVDATVIVGWAGKGDGLCFLHMGAGTSKGTELSLFGASVTVNGRNNFRFVRTDDVRESFNTRIFLKSSSVRIKGGHLACFARFRETTTIEGFNTTLVESIVSLELSQYQAYFIVAMKARTIAGFAIGMTKSRLDVVAGHTVDLLGFHECTSVLEVSLLIHNSTVLVGGSSYSRTFFHFNKVRTLDGVKLHTTGKCCFVSARAGHTMRIARVRESMNISRFDLLFEDSEFVVNSSSYSATLLDVDKSLLRGSSIKLQRCAAVVRTNSHSARLIHFSDTTLEDSSLAIHDVTGSVSAGSYGASGIQLLRMKFVGSTVFTVTRSMFTIAAAFSVSGIQISGRGQDTQIIASKNTFDIWANTMRAMMFDGTELVLDSAVLAIEANNVNVNISSTVIRGVSLDRGRIDNSSIRITDNNIQLTKRDRNWSMQALLLKSGMSGSTLLVSRNRFVLNGAAEVVTDGLQLGGQEGGRVTISENVMSCTGTNLLTGAGLKLSGKVTSNMSLLSNTFEGTCATRIAMADSRTHVNGLVLWRCNNVSNLPLGAPQTDVAEFFPDASPLRFLGCNECAVDVDCDEKRHSHATFSASLNECVCSCDSNGQVETGPCSPRVEVITDTSTLSFTHTATPSLLTVSTVPSSSLAAPPTATQTPSIDHGQPTPTKTFLLPYVTMDVLASANRTDDAAVVQVVVTESQMMRNEAVITFVVGTGGAFDCVHARALSAEAWVTQHLPEPLTLRVATCNASTLSLALTSSSSQNPLSSDFSLSFRRSTLLSFLVTDERIARRPPIEDSHWRVVLIVRNDFTPKKREVPAPKKAIETAKTGAAVGSIASAAAGNPAVATQAARTAVILDLVECNSNLGEELDWIANPTGYTLGEGDARFVAGACLMNPAIVAGFALLHFLVCLVMKARGAQDMELSDALAKGRFPSLLLIVILPLSEPTVAAATTVLRFGEGWRQLAAGGLAALSCLAVLLWMTYVTVFRFRSTFQTFDSVSSSDHGGGDTQGAVHKFVIGKGEWVDDGRSDGYVNRYFMLFDLYMPGRQWFGAVEVFFTFVLGVLDGWSPDTDAGCTTSMIAAGIFFFLFWLLVVGLRPYVALFNAALGVLIATMQMLAACAAIAFLVMGSDKAIMIAGWCAMSAMYVLILKALADLILTLHALNVQKMCKDKNKKDELERRTDEKSKRLLSSVPYDVEAGAADEEGWPAAEEMAAVEKKKRPPASRKRRGAAENPLLEFPSDGGDTMFMEEGPSEEQPRRTAKPTVSNHSTPQPPKKHHRARAASAGSGRRRQPKH